MFAREPGCSISPTVRLFCGEPDTRCWRAARSLGSRQPRYPRQPL